VKETWLPPEGIPSIISYCFFHLSQSVWRGVQSGGLEQLYRTSPEIRKNVRLMTALAFLPAELVVPTFEAINWMPEVAPIVSEWFEPTYIGKVTLGHRGNPLFPISEWNVYQRTLDGLSRTTNICEAYHNALQIIIGKDHPTVYVLLMELKDYLRCGTPTSM
jgi:hypothetical protein